MADTLAGFPYRRVHFDGDGRLEDAAEEAALREGPAWGGLHEAIVICHGWNNDHEEAERLYRRFLEKLRDVLRSRPGSRPPEEVGVVGVFWPSKLWADDAATTARGVRPGSARRRQRRRARAPSRGGLRRARRRPGARADGDPPRRAPGRRGRAARVPPAARHPVGRGRGVAARGRGRPAPRRGPARALRAPRGRGAGDRLARRGRRGRAGRPVQEAVVRRARGAARRDLLEDEGPRRAGRPRGARAADRALAGGASPSCGST